MKVFLKICFEPRFCPFLGALGGLDAGTKMVKVKMLKQVCCNH